MPITPLIPPEPLPLYSFTSALIVFDSSPNLKRTEELIKQKKIELPPKVGSCSDVKSGSDITRSMTRDSPPSANEIFFGSCLFSEVVSCRRSFSNVPLVEIEINITFSHPRNPLIADLADKLLLLDN